MHVGRILRVRPRLRRNPIACVNCQFANVGIAVSGIAGPGGAVPGKPVGTVWFALAHQVEGRLENQGTLIQFQGDRDAVRRQAVQYALNLLKALPPAG